MKSTTLALTTVISLLVAAMAGPSQLGAQQQPSYKVLYTFNGGTDGSGPIGLAGDGKGNFYGITNFGGDLSCVSYYYGCGTVFKVNANGTETVPWAFKGGADGTCSFCGNGVILDKKGNIYGGSLGGTTGAGLVFKVDPSGHLTVLYNFTGGADGFGYGSVSTSILDKEGNLYGTTDYGGELNGCYGSGCGVVFKLDPSGNETVLHTFTSGTDGALPFSGVVRDKAGNLYGATAFGGAHDSGIVFKVERNGKETVPYTFTGGADSYPSGPLIQDKAGNLYGATTCCGFVSPSGEVFKVDPNGNETVLDTFTGGVDGGGDGGGLVQDKAGNLYGTKIVGGNLACAFNPGGGCGVVFKLDPAGHETVLYNFCSQPNCADGAIPEYIRTLVIEEQDAAIRLYGATYYGGSQSGVCSGLGCGVAFELTVPKEED